MHYRGAQHDKILSKTRDDDYQFTRVNNAHKPITADPIRVEKVHYVAAIVKPTKFIDKCGRQQQSTMMPPLIIK